MVIIISIVLFVLILFLWLAMLQIRYLGQSLNVAESNIRGLEDKVGRIFSELGMSSISPMSMYLGDDTKIDRISDRIENLENTVSDETKIKNKWEINKQIEENALALEKIEKRQAELEKEKEEGFW